MKKDNIVIQFEKVVKVAGGVSSVSLSYNETTGVLALLDKSGNVMSQVDLPTERILKNAKYDETTGELVLEFDNSPAVRIPIGQLFDLSNYLDKTQTEQLVDNKVKNISYNSLKDKPTKVSQFANDAGYLTKHQDISGKANVTELESHKNNQNNPHKVTKTQLGLGNVNNVAITKEEVQQITQNKNAIQDLYNEEVIQNRNINTALSNANNAKAIAEGRTRAKVFDTYGRMIDYLKSASDVEFQIGDNLYIKDSVSSDYWVSEKYGNNSGIYGYYGITPLGSEKINFDDFVNLEEEQVITGYKKFDGGIEVKGKDLDTKLKEIVDSIPDPESIKDVEELPTENVNENVFYRKVEWFGISVPNTGTIENVYFNINLSVNEVDYLLNFLDVNEIYMILTDGTTNHTLNAYDDGRGRSITYVKNDVTMVLFSTRPDETFVGWNPNFNGVIEYNSVASSTGDFYGQAIPVGTQNKNIASLISITEFTPQSKLFNIKNGKAQELQNKLIASSGIEINDKTNEISSYAIRSASEVKEVTVEGDWVGTTVPNSGMVENIYFNTNLTVDEVVNILSLLDLKYSDMNMECLLCSADLTTTIAVQLNANGYMICSATSSDVYFVSSSDFDRDFVGWNPNITYPLSINKVVTNVFGATGVPTGTQNELINSLFSTTPFTKEQKGYEYIGNEKCIYGGGKSPVPNTGYVDKVYLDTSLSIEEVDNILNGITYNVEGVFEYLLASDTSCIMVANTTLSGASGYIIGAMGETVVPIYSSTIEELTLEFFGFAFTGWNPDFNGVIEFNSNAYSTMTDDGMTMPIGSQNNKLVDLFYMGGGSDNLFYLQNKQKKIIATKEDLSIQDVKELPKDKKEKVAIPTSGIVDTVYFNTDLSIDEVVALIDKLSVKEYYVFINEESIQSGDVMGIMIDKSSYSIYCVVDGVSNKIFTQSSGWDTSFPNSVTFNLQNDMTVMRHELQNDILVELMYCIKIEKEKINENVLYRVEEKGGWSGTTVPNTGYVENVYFNTNLSVQEVVSLFEIVVSAIEGDTDEITYFSLVNEDMSKMIQFVKNTQTNEYLMQTSENIVFIYQDGVTEVENYGFSGWNVDLINPMVVNSNVISSLSFGDGIDFVVGTQNDKLSSLLSITPFVKIESKPQLYHFKDRVPYKVGLTKEDVIDIINEQFENAEEGAY